MASNGVDTVPEENTCYFLCIPICPNVSVCWGVGVCVWVSDCLQLVKQFDNVSKRESVTKNTLKFAHVGAYFRNIEQRFEQICKMLDNVPDKLRSGKKKKNKVDVKTKKKVKKNENYKQERVTVGSVK